MTNTNATTDNANDVPMSLDAAAFVATTSTQPVAPAAAPAADNAEGGDNAAAEALRKVLESDEPAKTGDVDGQSSAEPRVRDFAKHGTDELEKLLRSGGDTDALPAKGEQPAAGADQDDDAGKTPTIPKARFDEVNGERKELKGKVSESEQELERLRQQAAKDAEEKAYLKGLLEGRGAINQPEGYTSTGGKPPVDKLKEFDDDLVKLDKDRKEAIKNLAKEYEDGKITMPDMIERQENINASAAELRRRIESVKHEYVQQANAPKHEDVKASINADPRLQTATKALFDKNPWIGHIPPAGAEVLLGLATQAMVKDGHKNEPTVESTWMLRQYMVKVGKDLGYDKLATAGASNTNANGNTDKTKAQPTAEQRKAKLELASELPPAPNLGGSANLPTDALGGIDYNSVGVRELSAMLPKETIGKLLGA